MQITFGGAPPEYTVKTSVVLVLFGYSKGARKVSGKCTKGTPAVLRGCLQGTRLSGRSQPLLSRRLSGEYVSVGSRSRFARPHRLSTKERARV